MKWIKYLVWEVTASVCFLGPDYSAGFSTDTDRYSDAIFLDVYLGWFYFGLAVTHPDAALDLP
jgi:hypothetical protein